MNKKYTLGAFAAVFIIIISPLSGCIIEDFLFGPQFIMNSWDVYNDGGFPSIYITYTNRRSVTLNLFDSFGKILDSKLVLYGTNDTTLKLGSYRETVNPGSYTLKVLDDESNELTKEKISIDTYSFSVLSTTSHWWKYNDEYRLIGFTLKLINNGNIPIYPYDFELNIQGASYIAKILPQMLDSGEIKNFYCFFYKTDIPEKSSCIIYIRDKDENVLGTHSLELSIDDVVSDKKFTWRYKWNNRQLTIPNPEFLLVYYSSLERINDEDYSLYVFDSYDDYFIDFVADTLVSGLDDENDVDKIEFVASFVQNLPYKNDSLTDSTFEYPQYPIETLLNINPGGDCEDKAILMCSFLKSMGYEVALLRLTNHMAVGVYIDENLTDYNYYTENYYFMETTTKNQKLGYIPDKYKFDPGLKVYPITDRPILIHEWKNGTVTIYKKTEFGDFVKVNVIVENVGSGDSEDFLVKAGFFTDDNIDLESKTELVDNLPSGFKKIITITVDIPTYGTSWFKTVIYLDGKPVDEKKSVNSFP